MAVTPEVGKTHTRYCRFLVNGYDLSGDMRGLSNFGATAEKVDATGWGDGTKQYLAGAVDVAMAITALFNDTATDIGPVSAGSHEVLKGSGEATCSVFIGSRSAPDIANSSGAAVFEINNYTASGDLGSPVMVDAGFGTTATVSQSSQIWGIALHAGGELAATTTNGSVDGLAQSTGGWIAFLHITQTAGAQAANDWSFAIEHSPDDGAWATLTTFTADGSTITAERKEAATTVDRYVRLKSTRTAGTARPWVTFIRK